MDTFHNSVKTAKGNYFADNIAVMLMGLWDFSKRKNRDHQLSDFVSKQSEMQR